MSLRALQHAWCVPPHACSQRLPAAHFATPALCLPRLPLQGAAGGHPILLRGAGADAAGAGGRGRPGCKQPGTGASGSGFALRSLGLGAACKRVVALPPPLPRPGWPWHEPRAAAAACPGTPKLMRSGNLDSRALSPREWLTPHLCSLHGVRGLKGALIRRHRACLGRGCRPASGCADPSSVGGVGGAMGRAAGASCGSEAGSPLAPSHKNDHPKRPAPPCETLHALQTLPQPMHHMAPCAGELLPRPAGAAQRAAGAGVRLRWRAGLARCCCRCCLLPLASAHIRQTPHRRACLSRLPLSCSPPLSRRPPPVVLSDDLVRDPEGTLRALCAALGLDFQPQVDRGLDFFACLF